MKPEKNENNKKAVDRRSALKLGATAALGGLGDNQNRFFLQTC